MNLNKLVPRLTVRAKLGIAFLLLTIVPLIVVALVTTPLATSRLYRSAEATMSSDLEVVRSRLTRSIREAEQHVEFLTTAFLAPLLLADAEPSEELRTTLRTFLVTDSSAVFRVKMIDEDGVVRMISARHADIESHGDELYYLLVAESAEPGTLVLQPIEVRDPAMDGDSLVVIPGLAIVRPVHDANRQLAGAVVAEAEASQLFGALEQATQDLQGVLGLVDAQGRFLYHSVRKRAWTSLLSATPGFDLRTDLPESVARAILSGDSGTTTTSAGEIVGYRSVRPTGRGSIPLYLYQAVPTAVIGAPVRQLLLATAITAVLVLGGALWISFIAADQLTRPLYHLQRAARTLAETGRVLPVSIETNDELEDLAADFNTMAHALADHREQLETTVEARTRDLNFTRTELSQIVMHTADAIIGLDAGDRVRFWNDGAEQLFGFQESEATGQHVDALIAGPGVISDEERAYTRNALEESGVIVNLRTARAPRNGDPFPVSLTQTSITDSDGVYVGSSLVVRDDRMARSLEEQMRRSERLAAVSIMAAGLAHELNNPLAIMGNRIELMQRDAVRDHLPDQTQKDLTVLGQHVERIRGITADLLAFARDEDEGVTQVDLGEVARRLVRLLERTFLTRGVQLQIDVDEHVPAVRGHEKALETVLANLLMNGLQATPSGGTVSITIRKSRSGPETVEIDVRDTGPGVPTAVRGRIFEPFFTTKGEAGGTGLGLTVCGSIVERHRGWIRLEHTSSAGSQFMVGLPLRSGAMG